MANRTLLALTAAAMMAAPAAGAETLRIGMITTLSGGGSGLGIDIRDGFLLGVAHADGRLGGLETEVIEADDERRPDLAVQLADRMVQRDEVHIVTGIVWSNLALAIMPTLARAETVFVSPNAGPSALAGEQCSRFFFNVAYQNDNNHEAMGQHVANEGYERVFLLAPNYPAGQDSLTGFKRFFDGEVVEEVYTQLGQLDYAAEIAQIRAAEPDAVFFFLPGGMGINFLKQYDQAGMKDEIPVFGPAFSLSQDILGAVGEAALDVYNTAQWSPDLDNAGNARFVADFQETYGRLPSLYAAQAYDAAQLIGAAVAAVDGDVADTDALIAALQAANFDSIRGPFRFNTNHFPIQDFYLRQVVALDDGTLTNRMVDTVFTDHADVYAEACSF